MFAAFPNKLAMCPCYYLPIRCLLMGIISGSILYTRRTKSVLKALNLQRVQKLKTVKLSKNAKILTPIVLLHAVFCRFWLIKKHEGMCFCPVGLSGLWRLPNEYSACEAKPPNSSARSTSSRRGHADTGRPASEEPQAGSRGGEMPTACGLRSEAQAAAPGKTRSRRRAAGEARCRRRAALETRRRQWAVSEVRHCSRASERRDAVTELPGGGSLR